MSLVGDSLVLYDALAEPLAWAVVATFLAGTLLETQSRPWGRRLLVGGWGLFAVFWAVQTPHFAFEQKSIIETVGSAIAAPAAIYVGYLLHSGRDSLFVLSRAVAAMGLVFMPFHVVDPLRQMLVETVTAQTAWAMGIVGVDPAVLTWSEAAARTAEALGQPAAWQSEYATKYHDFRNTFYFEDGGHPITYTILIACTGLGSMAIFAGLIAAVNAPLDRKVRAFAVSIPVIYVLNIARNVFIGVSFGKQLAHVAPDLVMRLFGTTDPRMVSYYVADRIIAQSLSVVALVFVTYLVVRELPEILVVVEDLLFVATGTEYDLAADLGLEAAHSDPERPVRPEGEAGD